MIQVYTTPKGYSLYQHGAYLVGFTRFEDVVEWLTFMGHEGNFRLLPGHESW